MSRLAEELHSIPPRSRRVRECAFARWHAGLDEEEDKDAVTQLLRTSREEISLRSIYTVLEKFQVPFAYTALRDHAARRCVCSRDTDG